MKESVNMIVSNDKYYIEIDVDESYSLDSTDNRFYDYELITVDSKIKDYIKTFSIKITQGKKVISVALIGGMYSISDNSAILENDTLTILMCDTLIFLDLDSIRIIKKVLITDFGTCFAIYPFDDGYVIHGELEIIKTDKIGNVEWTFSGADIFATIDNNKAFSILDKTIILHDFVGNTYKLNEYGEQV